MQKTNKKRSPLDVLSGRLDGALLQSAARHGAVRWMVLAGAFAVIVAAMTRVPERATGGLLETLDKEIVASERLQASFSFDAVDLARTEEARKAAEARVPYTYQVRPRTVNEQLAAFDARAAAIMAHQPPVAARVLEALRASTAEQPAAEVAARAVADYVEELEEEPLLDEGGVEPRTLVVWLTPDPDTLPRRVYAEAEESQPKPVVGLEPDDAGAVRFTLAGALRGLAREHLEAVLREGIREPSLAPDTAERPVVILRAGTDQSGESSEERALGDAPDPARAAQVLRNRLESSARRWAEVEGEQELDWGKLSDAAMDVARPFLTDTLYLDEAATRQARVQKGNAVEPLTREIQARETIINEGERWNAQSRSDARQYLQLLQSNEQPRRRFAALVTAHAIFAALVLACLNRGIEVFGPKAAEDRTRFLYLALLLMSGLLAVGRITHYFEPTGFIVPVAAAAILYAILVNVRLATLFSLLTVGLLSVQYGYNWRLGAVGLAMSLAGVFSIYKVRRRGDMTAASLKAAGAGVLAMAAVILAMDDLFSEAAARHMGLIAFNGFICMLLVPGLLPPLEKLFNVTTDIQLLEFSDLNNEVLGRLAVEVPNTWAHSLMLGQLAESVAESIGANGLLARVCAYYHDIGKMRRPGYFSENQQGHNVHDGMTPRMSARAIASHVADGVETARQYRLPRPIIDAIREHHGTSLVSFFYQQAKDNARHGDVSDADFRYPGPRPQSRETAILMICDAVESGVRSIKNPNEERVREFVDKIIQSRSRDRQFDDCDLTLKDLDDIAELLTKRVVGTLHTRIAYPEMERPPEEGGENIVPMAGGNVP